MSSQQAVSVHPANLLLVEDDEVDAQWALRALSHSPLRVEHVDSLKRALVRLEDNDIQLILLDLGLPDNNGEVGCIERIHAITPDIPIIVYSGTAYEATGLLAVEKGALYFFPKRISDANLLVRTVQQALERFRLQENLRRVIMSSGDGMAIFSSIDRRLLFANPSAEAMLGVSSDDADYMFPHQLKPGAMTQLKLNNKLEIELRVAHIDWDGQPALLANMRDISDRLRFERQLRQMQKMEAVGMLASGVAHDFNNILTVINGFTDLLLDEAGAGSPMVDDLKQIKAAGDRAGNLIRRLLTFSRGSEGEPQLVRLDQIVIDAHNMFQHLIGAEIDLILSTQSHDHWIVADPSQIEQVVVNLVINARDAMPDGGTLTINTYGVHLDENFEAGSMPLPRSGEYVALAITDTGTGMSEDIVEHMFEPFFSTKEEGQGTGLGLATSYGIVKQCQGSISVLSEPGHGTTIKVFLPCASEPQTTAADDSSAVTVHDGDETLLLVEDEEFVRRFTAQLLTARGYRVIVAATPAEALELAGEHLEDIDLIVTDVVMPGMSGGQLVRQLKESKPGLSVIFISGYSEDEVIHRGLANSRMHFLQKPFTPIDLTRLVREVLDSGKLSTQ